MALIKENQIAEDPWIFLDDDAPVPGNNQHIVVSLDRWRQERDQLIERRGPIGVKLASDQSPALIADDIAKLALVALEFPAFKDGRAFSYARLLRERYGFDGEVRAVGDVLRDQLFFMHRCGIDAFQVKDERVLQDWLEAAQEFSMAYQPAADDRHSIIQLRRSKRDAAE